jgi:hypothetical protein
MDSSEGIIYKHEQNESYIMVLEFKNLIRYCLLIFSNWRLSIGNGFVGFILSF